MFFKAIDIPRGVSCAVAVVVLVSVCSMLTAGVVAGTAPAGMAGNGTVDDPYEVTNGTQLQAINGNLSDHFVLTTDLDMAGYGTLDPIGNLTGGYFDGSFDGQGRTISNLTINSTEYEVGLFGYIMTGTVGNVTLSNVSVTGDSSVGAMAGRSHGDVHNVTVTGSVQGMDSVGGVVGYNLGNVSHVHADASVNGSSGVGGVIGWNNAFNVLERSSSTSTVTATENAGGIAGVNYGTITNVSAAGSVTANQSAGGLVGFIENYGAETAYVNDSLAAPSVSAGDGGDGVVGEYAGGEFHSTYWDSDTSPNSANGTGLSTDELTGDGPLTSTALSFDDPWITTDGYPQLGWQISDLTVALENTTIGVGASTSATVTLSTATSTVTASNVAALSSADPSVADGSSGAVTGTGEGVTTITASHAGLSDAESITVVHEPPVVSATIANTGEPHSIGAPGPMNGTIIELFPNGIDGLGSIYSYDAGAWHRVTDVDQPLSAMDAFVAVTTGAGPSSIQMELVFDSEATVANHSLETGWNLVPGPAYVDAETGFGSQETLLVIDRFAKPYAPTFPTVSSFDTYVVGSEGWGESPPALSPVGAYFVYADAPADLPLAVTDVGSLAHLESKLAPE